MTSGYSKTSLSKKLGLKPNFNIYLFNEPKHYFELLNDIPEGVLIAKQLNKQHLDFIHGFFKTESKLKSYINELKNHLKPNGMLWVSWPKGSSKIITDINRESVRLIVLETGLVDIKVAAIDEDWSGLKFVYRLKDRA